MKKLLSNKWGQFLLVCAYSLLFFLLSVLITASSVKEGGTHSLALGSSLIYFSIPALYFVTVLLNYLRFGLTKLVRYLIFIAAMALAVGGLIAILVGNFDEWHVLKDPAGYSFCYGMATGSLITWTLLFFDFKKMGFNPKNAEQRTWLQVLIMWGIFFAAPFVGLGLVYLIIHAIKKEFILIIFMIALILLTAGSVWKSISMYGNPLGSSKEWDEWRKKHPIKTSGSSSSSYSSGSSSSSSSSSSSAEQKRVISGDIYHKIIGMYNSWVEITSAGVYEQGPNNFQIELTLRDTYNGNDKGPDWGHTIEHLARELVDQVGDIVSNMGASCTISVKFE